MRLKRTPTVAPRYWTAIMLASMCGTNFGDVFSDVLKIDVPGALLLLSAMFALIFLVDNSLKRGSEASYWSAILVVRAAATQIADAAIDKRHPNYALVAGVLALVLAALLAAGRRTAAHRSTDGLPATDGFYWLTMLTAGALGTIIGDGLGHAFRTVQIGVPVSAATATAAVAMVLAARRSPAWRTPLSYWVAIVAVRWWGTNLGDILAFFGTLIGSLTVTGLALLIVLSTWRDRPTSRKEPLPSAASTTC